jgi:hypothetical protein
MYAETKSRLALWKAVVAGVVLLVPASLVPDVAGVCVVTAPPVVAGDPVVEVTPEMVVPPLWSEQAAVPSTTMARPALPISAIAIRRLIRR